MDDVPQNLLKYRDNHEENKKLKIKYEPEILSRKYSTNKKLWSRIEKLMELELRDYTTAQDMLYSLIKKEGLKITKKEISNYIMRYY
jgi:hypothetical protein